MNWDVGQIGLWLLTSFVGAAIVKLIDLAATRYLHKHTRIEQKVTKILEYVKEYGELTELYRFLAYVSERVVMNETGDIARNADGEAIIESQVLQPEPRFEEALKALNGIDVNSAITQKIATIRLMSSEVLDIALELDPSGTLKKRCTDLYLKTVYSIEVVLNRRKSRKPDQAFDDMVNALDEADETRRKLRLELEKLLN